MLIRCIIFQVAQPFNRNCWKYSFSANNWVINSTMSFDQGRRPGILWNDKIYLLNDGNPQGSLKTVVFSWSHFC